MRDAIDRALAELHRRHEQQQIAAERDTHPVETQAYHRGVEQGYRRALEMLSDMRPPDAVDASVPDTGVTIDTDELVIVEVTEAGHRRRTYRAAPDAPELDARLEVASWHSDGWRVVGEEPVAQLAINGERVFEV